VRLQHELTIARTPAEVFAFLANPVNLPAWQGSVQRVTVPEHVAAGTRFTEERARMGRVFRSTLDVVELEPDRLFTIRVVEGVVPARIRHELSAEPGGTRLSVVAEADLGRLPRVVRSLVARSVDSELRRDFATLKRIVESTPGDARS
jgi:carbon monoxide dehydrogenase subunit G